MSRGNKKYSEKERFFDNVDVLTSRPEGMPYDEYKKRMKAQKKVIKQYLKGELIHVSKLYPSKEMLANLDLKRLPSVFELASMEKHSLTESLWLFYKGKTYERSKSV